MWIGWDTRSLAFRVGERSAWCFDFRTLVFARAPDFLVLVVVEGDRQPLERKPQQCLMQKTALRHFHWLPIGVHPRTINHCLGVAICHVQKVRDGPRVARVLPHTTRMSRAKKSRRNSESNSTTCWRARRDSNS